MTKRWQMSDLKAKGIFVNPKGEAKKLVGPVKKKITQKDIDKAINKAKTKSKGKFDIDGKSFITYFLTDLGIEFKTEYLFWPGRKFRFDFAIPTLLIACEYEGLFSAKSRHTTISGYTRDSEKYNKAVADGWKVYRYTAATFRNITEDLKHLSPKIVTMPFPATKTKMITTSWECLCRKRNLLKRLLPGMAVPIMIHQHTYTNSYGNY